ncbi:hypothetical protein HMPREF9499_00427 [Enterococcus faecalis TX0012]|nr:hypothetical protein HMPREF9499_00427 [Enterococcus faecalis TX0012]
MEFVPTDSIFLQKSFTEPSKITFFPALLKKTKGTHCLFRKVC